MTGTEEWEAIERRITEDLLVDLALGRSRRRPPRSALPIGLQRDIRAGWADRLRERGYALRGHRLVRSRGS